MGGEYDAPSAGERIEQGQPAFYIEGALQNEYRRAFARPMICLHRRNGAMVAFEMKRSCLRRVASTLIMFVDLILGFASDAVDLAVSVFDVR